MGRGCELLCVLGCTHDSDRSKQLGVYHGQEARLSVLALKVLVLELLAIDGLATSAVAVGKVTLVGVGRVTSMRRRHVCVCVVSCMTRGWAQCLTPWIMNFSMTRWKGTPL